MALSRAALAAELWGLLQRSFMEIGITNSDTSGNLKEPVDFTLSAMGVAYADRATGEIADGDEAAALLVARYAGLRAVYDAALHRVDVQMSASSPSVSRSDNYSQFVRQLENAIKDAKVDASPYLPADGTYASGTISLGFLPSCDDIALEWST